MKEQLYSIPVNDAFAADCECPVCQMYHKLETDSVEYTMGPSYMEDDTRALTDAKGFCGKHIKMVYDQDNRLGMAWVMKTHFDKTINDIKKVMPSGPAKLIKKGISDSPLIKYIDNLDNSCFVCDRINNFLTSILTQSSFSGKKMTNSKKNSNPQRGSAHLITACFLKRLQLILKVMTLSLSLESLMICISPIWSASGMTLHGSLTNLITNTRMNHGIMPRIR